MTRQRRSFGSNIPLPVDGLELEVNDQVFKVRSSMSGLRLLKIIGSMDGDDEGAAATAMIDFLESAFLLEDRERGMAYLLDSEPPVSFDVLQDIIEWLIEQYTKKVTAPSSQSSDGLTANTGPTITEQPFEPVSTS